MPADPLRPDFGTLVRIGSALVHLMEAARSQGTKAHAFDLAALKTNLDNGVTAWLREMNAMGLLPVMRDAKRERYEND